MRPRLNWVTVSSLKKLKGGEAARVLWPPDGTDPSRIPYREGFLEIEEWQPKRNEDGVLPPKQRGLVFFRWNDNAEDRIEVFMPRQVEVLRNKSKTGSSRRLG